MNTQTKQYMNTQEQAYINGFVKRASEYGLSPSESSTLLKESSTRAMRELLNGGSAAAAIMKRLQLNQPELPAAGIAQMVNRIKLNPKGIVPGKRIKLPPEDQEWMWDVLKRKNPELGYKPDPNAESTRQHWFSDQSLLSDYIHRERNPYGDWQRKVL